MEIGYGGDETQCVPRGPDSLIDRCKQPSIEDRLIQRKQRLESDLEDVNKALLALQANPEVLKIMCLISKVNY